MISFASRSLPSAAFLPLNNAWLAIQSAFSATLVCSSIPIRRPVQLAEVETGANQRPLGRHCLQATAKKAPEAHNALDLPKDRFPLFGCAICRRPAPPRFQLTRHTWFRGDVVRDPAMGKSIHLVCLRFSQTAAVVMNNSWPSCSNFVTSS